MDRVKVRTWPVLAALVLGACAAGGGAGGGGGGGTGSSGGASAASGVQTNTEIAEMMKGLRPTERLVANADSRLLWQATSGYMGRAFPLDDMPAGAADAPAGSRQIRTKLVEWVGDGLPHRTRVFVEIRPDAANAADMRLRVAALMIEPELDLEGARDGQPLRYNWRLVGNNTRVEETVVDQIMRRYLALVEGKPIPVDEELIVPTRRPG